ncbi:hypothetical protein vseg_001799 [Gypsophila vaccaria]
MKMPTVQFDGTGDPEEQFITFESYMYMYEVADAAWFKVFSTTQTGSTQTWFCSQPTGSIKSYEELKKSFCDQYAGNRQRERSTTELFTIRHRKGEGIRDFIRMFDLECQQVRNLDPSMAVFAIIYGLL